MMPDKMMIAILSISILASAEAVVAKSKSNPAILV